MAFIFCMILFYLFYLSFKDDSKSHEIIYPLQILDKMKNQNLFHDGINREEQDNLE